ncbi:lantibiotic dehydratase [Sphingobacterium multivorum]|uniref:lantibiotic dehydratase n=1 Tax=Sphingobacterium multivorum TaxID=28454 RepID=UPI0031BB352E
MNQEWITEFFVLRKPVLAQNYLQTQWDEDLHGNLSKLSNETLEAIFVASPTLYKEIVKTKDGQGALSEEKKEKLLKSLYKYINRASNRCTPFGLFSSCSTGKITDSKDNLDLRSGKIIKHARLDMDILSKLALHLKGISEIRNKLLYSSNSSLYYSKKKFKYFEYRYSKDGYRSFHLSSTDSHNVIKDVIRFCNTPRAIDEISMFLVQRYPVEEEDVHVYLNELINNSVLLSSIDPNVTGPEYFEVILAEVKRISVEYSSDTCDFIYQNLVQIQEYLSVIFYSKNQISDYHSIQKILCTIMGTDSIDTSNTFQVDMIAKNRDLNLNKEFVDTLISSIEELNSYNQIRRQESFHLRSFKWAFLERYEQQDVRLVELFDKVSGLGYRNLFHDTRPFSSQIPEPAIAKLAHEKYLDFIKNGDQIIQIEAEDILPNSSSTKLPDNFSIMGNLLSKDGESFFNIITTPSSTTNLIGRFCHADQKLLENVKTHLTPSNGNGIIHAEIAHLPQSRIGNILSRPNLLDWEVEFLSTSKVEGKRKIAIADLYVKVENNEVILYSKKYKKRIIPRLSSAHNYSNFSLELYHFLCDLQNQHSPVIQLWTWPENLQNKTFLPRVVYKNIIISMARWILDCRLFKAEMLRHKRTFAEQLRQFQNDHGLPDVFQIMNGDNFLVIDSKNSISIAILEKEVGNGHSLMLVENLYENFDSPVIQDSRIYSNEIVLPVRRRKELFPVPKFVFKPPVLLKRTFLFGEEWTYIKIYCKEKFGNDVLKRSYNILKKTKEQFFFIRYRDPLPHLRIRIKMNNLGTVLNPLLKALSPLVGEGIIFNIVTDKYNREIERYGESTMLGSESYFGLSSILVLDYLNIKTNQNTHAFAVKVIDNSLDLLKCSYEQKMTIYKQGFGSFAQEFNFFNNKHLQKAISKNFNEIRKSLDEEKHGPNSTILQDYLKKLQVLITDCDRPDQICTHSSLIRSHIHMFINRLFPSNQRMEELLIYFSLEKYGLYNSKRKETTRSL